MLAQQLRWASLCMLLLESNADFSIFARKHQKLWAVRYNLCWNRARRTYWSSLLLVI